MESHQNLLVHLLATDDSENFEKIFSDLVQLSEVEVANLFIDVCFLCDGVPFIAEKIWLQQKKNSAAGFNYKFFINETFARELKPIQYLSSHFLKREYYETKPESKKALFLKNAIVRFIKLKTFEQQKSFLIRSLNVMADYFLFENEMQKVKSDIGIQLGFSLYQTFEKLDEVLNLDYAAHDDLQISTAERLYSGSGAGVQSGYSTILMAIDQLQLCPGCRFIDLGSGFGRVGLMIGLLRPDIQFTGYEFVEARVDIANQSAKNLGLENHVHFLTQDLSEKRFEIPPADFYYLFDPFTDDTYAHVVSQLVALGKEKKISILTKGNAKNWMLDAVSKENWDQPLELDNRNLCVFRS